MFKFGPSRNTTRIMISPPKFTNALVLCQATSESKSVYHDIVVASRPVPSLKQGEILVKITAVAFNRRDLWIRLGQYPGITFNSVLGADGVGL
jgi:NADPH:quinone reductase-like Zn-dependent oxidoreductase